MFGKRCDASVLERVKAWFVLEDVKALTVLGLSKVWHGVDPGWSELGPSEVLELDERYVAGFAL